MRHADRLPKRRGEQGHADPYDLPRQERGTTPQMHGRYPEHDVLAQARHWDETTRQVVFDRVENVPPIRFFGEDEARTLGAFCDTVTAQDAEPRIPVLAYVDERLHGREGVGWQFFDLPDDGEVWRLVARGLDEEARREGSASFGEAALDVRLLICHRFANAQLHGGAWAQLNVSNAWSVVMRDVLSAFYAHPWAWNEIGFGGPAYPRGYARFGSPHLHDAERETWEGKQALDVDPVRDTRERGLE